MTGPFLPLDPVSPSQAPSSRLDFRVRLGGGTWRDVVGVSVGRLGVGRGMRDRLGVREGPGADLSS